MYKECWVGLHPILFEEKGWSMQQDLLMCMWVLEREEEWDAGKKAGFPLII